MLALALLAPAPVVMGGPVIVEFTCAEASGLFAPGQQTAMQQQVPPAVLKFCSDSLKPWSFTAAPGTAPEAAEDSPRLTVSLKISPALQLCMSLKDRTGQTLCEDAVEIVAPGAFFPPLEKVTERMTGDVRDANGQAVPSYLSQLLKKCRPNLRRSLVQCAEVEGQAPEPVGQVSDVANAMGELFFNLERFTGVVVESFRLEGECGDDHLHTTFFCAKRDVTVPPAAAGDRPRMKVRFIKCWTGQDTQLWEDLGPSHLRCLSGFTVRRVYLLAEPVQTALPSGASASASMIPPPPPSN